MLQQFHDLHLQNFRVTPQNRFKVFTFLTFITLVPYLLNNRYSYFPPHTFELTDIEKQIPFLDWSVWIYVSDYIFPFAVGVSIASSLVLSRACLGVLLMAIVTNLTFF